MIMKTILFLTLSLLSLTVHCQNERLALVVGNSEYEHIKPLENPVNDANLIRSSLQQVGFRVILVSNATKRELQDAIREFGEAMTNPDSSYNVGMFFYAGHGIQYESKNFLIPVDATIESDFDIEDNCVSINKLNRYFELDNSNLLITVLDACRNNPFAAGRSLGGGNGLAKMEVISGSLVAYSTQPGNTADDGKGLKNSIYSEELAKQITEPNQSLEEVFKNVRTEVEKRTDFKQSPREESALRGGSFYFSKSIETSSIKLNDIIRKLQEHNLSSNYDLRSQQANIALGFFQDLESLDSKNAKKLLIIANSLNRDDEFMKFDYQERQIQNFYLSKIKAYSKLIEYHSNNKNSSILSPRDFASIKYKNLVAMAFLAKENRILSDSTLLLEANDLYKFCEDNFSQNSIERASAEYILAFFCQRNYLTADAVKYSKASFEHFQASKYSKSELIEVAEYEKLDETSLNLFLFNAGLIAKNSKHYNSWFGYDSELDYQKDQLEIAGYKSADEFYLDICSKIRDLIDIALASDSKQKYLSDLSDALETLDYSIYAFPLGNMDVVISVQDLLKNYLQGFLSLTNISVDRVGVYDRTARSMYNLFWHVERSLLYKGNTEIVIGQLKQFEDLIDMFKQETLDQKEDGYIERIKVTMLEGKVLEIFHNRLKGKLNLDTITSSNLLSVSSYFQSINETLPLCSSLLDSLKTSQYSDYYKRVLDGYVDVIGDADMLSKSDFKKIESQIADLKINLIMYSGDYGTPKMIEAYDGLARAYRNKGLFKEQIKTQSTNLEYINRFEERWLQSSINLGEDYRLLSNAELVHWQKLISLHDICVSAWENYLVEDLDSNVINTLSAYTDNQLLSPDTLSFRDWYEESLTYFHLILGIYFGAEFNGNSLTSSDTQIAIKHMNQARKMALVKLNSQQSNVNRYWMEKVLAHIDWRLAWKAHEKSSSLESENYYELLLKDGKYYKNYKPGIEINAIFRVYKDFMNARSEKEGQKIALKAAQFWKDQMEQPNFYKWYYYDNTIEWYSSATNYKWCSTKLRQELINTCHGYIQYLHPYLEKATEDPGELNLSKNEIIERLNDAYYAIIDQHYWIGNKDSTVYYYDVVLNIIEQSTDSSYATHYYNVYQDNKVWVENEVGNIENAIATYGVLLDKVYGPDHMDKIKFGIIHKKIGGFEIPFLKFELKLPQNFYPFIEFDVNSNLVIDPKADKRYFYDFKNEDLFTEFVDTIEADFGPFSYYHLDRTGKKYQDTTDVIYFDQSTTFESASSFKLYKNKTLDDRQGLYYSNGKINHFQIEIPLEEVSSPDSKEVRFIISTYTDNDEHYIHSRRYKKFMFPPASRITRFKDAYSIQL
jgi:hypothetical protein